MKLSAEDTENTRLRNSRMGRIGSAARSSTHTTTISDRADAANSPMIAGDAQAY
jgi:hypothetical protein